MKNRGASGGGPLGIRGWAGPEPRIPAPEGVLELSVEHVRTAGHTSSARLEGAPEHQLVGLQQLPIAMGPGGADALVEAGLTCGDRLVLDLRYGVANRSTNAHARSSKP
jgi:hypothetical protein